jgi:predicted phosphohydrolase
VEIQALAQKLGLSYKDAAHRLYMAEIERLKMADSAAKSFSALKHRMDKIVSHELYPPISAIDAGEFDNYILKDGHWENTAIREAGPSNI